jgi:RNA polymerase sigma factor (sigma-70 family)
MPVSDRDKPQKEPPHDLTKRLNAEWQGIEASLLAYLGKQGAETEAPDIVQETYLRILGRNKTEAIESLAGYALTVARNLVTQQKKYDSRHDSLDESYNVEDQAQWAAEEHHSPERISAGQQDLEQISREFDGLSEDEKLVFLAARLNEESVKAIAKRLNMGTRMVYRRLKSALVRLGDSIGRPRGERDK